MFRSTVDNKLTRVNDWLWLWLSKVRASGHDLEDYGRREKELLVAESINSKRVHVCYPKYSRNGDYGYWFDMGPPHVVWLRGYQYGPEPEDWKILWSVPEKSYAADFWRFVENEHQPMPGAWVDDSDDDEDDSLH